MPDEKNRRDRPDEKNPDSEVEPPAHPARNHNEPTNPSGKNSCNKKDRTAELEQDIRTGERWLIGIGIVTLVINTIIACIYWGQLSEMRKATKTAATSADAAKSAAETAAAALGGSITQFRQQVRPYVIVETTRINRRPTEGVVIGIEAVIKNTGSTPALNLRVSHTFRLEDKLPCPAFVPVFGGPDEGIIDIGSGVSRAIRVFGQKPPAGVELRGIENGTLFICYSAAFEYSDIFREKHRTETCSYYRPVKAAVAVGVGDLFLYSCPQHNSVQ